MQKLVGCLSQIWVQPDNLPLFRRLAIWHIQLQPTRARLQHPFSCMICQQTDRQQTNTDGHQWAEGRENAIMRENWFLVRLRTSRLRSYCGMPRFRELLLSRRWPSWPVCCSFPFAAQTVSWEDAKACTSIHRMPPVLQTGTQSRPTGRWLKGEMIIPWACVYR